MKTNDQELLIVFAREPVPGVGKTRLAADTDPAYAHAVYKRLLARTLRLAHRFVRSRQESPGCQLLVAGDWEGETLDTTSYLQQFCRHADSRLRAQSAADLGARMAEAFAYGFEQGFERIVLMGCDCPTLTNADLRVAFDQLESHDTVIAPTADGGYCLIGLTGPAPALFESMTWSVPTVFSETIARAANRRVARLGEQHDIDTLSDWQRWCEQRASRGLAEALAGYPSESL